MATLQAATVKGTVILIQSGGFADQGHDLKKATIYFQHLQPTGTDRKKSNIL